MAPYDRTVASSAIIRGHTSRAGAGCGCAADSSVMVPSPFR